MAISAAHAVSPKAAADNAGANASALFADNGNAQNSAFLDSLEAVLGVRGVATGKAGPGDADIQSALLTSDGLSKLKGKLKTDAANPNALPEGMLASLSAQQQLAAQPVQPPAGQQTSQQQNPALAAQQQTAIGALQNTGSGIGMPALRAALANAGKAGAHTMPAYPAQNTDGTATASPPVQASTAAAQNRNAVPGDQTATAPGNTAADGSTTAGTKTSQADLVAALQKNAQAPVLKGREDGSTVANSKIGHRAHAKKQDSETAQLAQLATRIAATAGAANTADMAPVAAQAVAVAEVTARAAASTATPAVTNIEAAAMSNSAQSALHVAAPQARTEAQALPIAFDAQQPAQASDEKADAQTDSDKDRNGPDNSRGANNATAATNTQTQPAPDSAQQQQQPVQQAQSAPAQTASADPSSTATLAASISNTAATTPQAASPAAANLQVAPQTQQPVPSPDQATFAALGVAIAAKSRDGEHQFDIKMDPAELGKVDVRISVNSAGQAQAHLSVQHQHTLEILQNDKATLERNLRDAGLNLANNGLNFSLKGEQQPSTPTFNARSRALSISALQSADSTSSISSTSIAPGDSRLDIRV